MTGMPSHSPTPQTEIHTARDSLISGYSYLSTLGHGKCAPGSPTLDPPARQDLERVGRQAGSCGRVLIPDGWAIGFNGRGPRPKLLQDGVGLVPYLLGPVLPRSSTAAASPTGNGESQLRRMLGL